MTAATPEELAASPGFLTSYLARVMARATLYRESDNPPPRGAAAHLLALAKRHRVGSSVFDDLARSYWSTDLDTAALLAEEARLKKVKALRLAAETARLSRAFSRAGIRHLAIKGTTLAQQLYADPAARDSKDIDFLIDFRRAGDVHELLVASGLRPDCERPNRSLAVGSVLEDKHRTYFTQHLHVEVHDRLTNVPTLIPLTFEQLWEEREVAHAAGIEIPVLGATHCLLYLCAHGTGHSWFRLKWLQDIARIALTADRSTLDKAYSLASDWRSEPVLLSSFQLVERLFGIESPFNSSGDPAIAKLVALATDAIAAPDTLTFVPSISWLARKIPVHFQLRRDGRYHAEYLRHLLLAPRSFDQGRNAGWTELPLRTVRFARNRLRLHRETARTS